MTEPDELPEHPINERLAEGIGDGPTRESESQQDLFLKWIREQARKKLESGDRNREIISVRVDDSFKIFINDVYFSPTVRPIESRESWAVLGRRYGNVNQTTVKRWVTGTDPQLSHISIAFAAEDAFFPRGHHVAINAYAFAFLVARSSIGTAVEVAAESISEELSTLLEDWADEAKETDGPIPVFAFDQNACEEALILYLVMRTPAWWKAIRTGQRKYEEQAADYIQHVARDLFPTVSEWDAERVKALIEKHSESWTIMEEVLPYEWL
ncbi:hypothetical protein [Rubinisphaera italica]|uniref:Uncharacterized protein n=1 Tax=Rubinisphaera italica TaxID=2527969 RepID=A0A5C5XFM9_9PLAN|nr:hypothetical protein [Rubinisphaera italica]TWT60955.1 hypothetical protein Pan54_16870 [Rubinisphaera italica]